MARHMDEFVIVDTCIWASFFSKPGSKGKLEVDKLIDADRVSMIGPILAEVLLGFRRKDQADWASSRLLLTHYVDITPDDWRAAADEGRVQASRGNKLPLTDLVAVSIARRLNLMVYSVDPHFDLFEDLRRYDPE